MVIAWARVRSGLSSVRWRILATVLVLSSVAVSLAGLNLHTAFVAKDAALTEAAVAAAMATLNQATFHISMERNASQRLIERQAADAAAVNAVEAYRHQVDGALDQLMQQVAHSPRSRRFDGFVDTVRGLRTHLADVRRTLDGLLTVPYAERPSSALQSWPLAMNDLVLALQMEWHELRTPELMLPVQVAMLVNLREAAWRIHEFGDREATYLAIALENSQPLSPERMGELAGFAEVIDQSWLEIGRIVNHLSNMPALRQAMAKLDESYFVRHRALRQAVLVEAGARHAIDQVGLSAYIDQSQEALRGIDQFDSTTSRIIDDSFSRHAYQVELALLLAAVIVAFAVSLVVLVWLYTFSVFRRMHNVRGRMMALAAGDTDAAVPDVNANDEVGLMARALLVFRDTALERQKLVDEAAHELIDKEKRQAAVDRHIRDFTASLAGVMRTLGGAAHRMDIALQGMAGAAGRAGDLACNTAEDAKTSVVELGTVADGTDHLRHSIEEISNRVGRATAVVQEMTARATEAETTMASLAEAAERVSDVARFIGDVAGQTNLLALNATIEAARAGAAGKGFAVVASEVKQLAARTAAATVDISAQIQSIQNATTGAVGKVRQMGVEVRLMEDMAAAIATAVEQQGKDVGAIAASITSLTSVTQVAVSAMGEASQAAEEARFASSEVWYAAGDVGKQAESLGDEFEHFMRSMAGSAKDKRRFERIPGRGALVTVKLPNDDVLQGTLVDISRGGLAVKIGDTTKLTALTAGTPVTAMLPGAVEVPMRVVHADENQVGLIGMQVDGAEEKMEAAMAYVASLPEAA